MTETYRVGGMNCGGCVAAVTQAIKRLDPTAKVQVDLESGNVRIDRPLARDAVRRAVEDAGFTFEV
ncbi:MAG TPA: heavy-metal-associated domain-containing protein [Stellaceae bacterium]|nr:heavy-metal-associated domain-containing protein [Stellaceae bacterium]